ncbi:hypothetical protein ACFX12_026836 [Malus domestica]
MGPLFSLLLLGHSPLDLPVYFLCSHKPGELASLVEDLRTGKETSLEEFIIGPPNVLTENQGNQIRLYGPKKGLSYIVKPATGQSFISHHGSTLNKSRPLVDPLVTLLSSVHEKMSERGSKGSMFYPNLGSILNAGEYHNKNAHWDIESQTDGEDHESEAAGAYCDESLRSPLISRQTTIMGKPRSGGSALGLRRNTILMKGNVEASEAISSSMDTGGEKVPPSEAVIIGPTWRDLEPGVKRLVVVGIGLQILQQVYEQACIAVLLFNIGLIPTCISLRKCHYNFLNASLHCYAHVANGYNWQKVTPVLHITNPYSPSLF